MGNEQLWERIQNGNADYVRATGIVRQAGTTEKLRSVLRHHIALCDEASVGEQVDHDIRLHALPHWDKEPCDVCGVYHNPWGLRG